MTLKDLIKCSCCGVGMTDECPECEGLYCLQCEGRCCPPPTNAEVTTFLNFLAQSVERLIQANKKSS